MLAPTEYEITEAENGEILMAIQLPIMDGYEAKIGPLFRDRRQRTRRNKADVSLRSIPIIAVTSYALSGEGQKARAAGCDNYVPKPYSPRELLARIPQYMPQ
jgi:two-component system, cell cycle response regulator DivK